MTGCFKAYSGRDLDACTTVREFSSSATLLWRYCCTTDCTVLQRLDALLGVVDRLDYSSVPRKLLDIVRTIVQNIIVTVEHCAILVTNIDNGSQCSGELPTDPAVSGKRLVYPLTLLA